MARKILRLPYSCTANKKCDDAHGDDTKLLRKDLGNEKSTDRAEAKRKGRNITHQDRKHHPFGRRAKQGLLPENECEQQERERHKGQTQGE